MGNRRQQRKKLKSLYVWHRYAGLFTALFIIFITVSGIALNHTDDLALKKKHISSNILLDSYNIQAPSFILQFSTGQRVVTQADNFLFINAGNAITAEEPLIGVAEFDNFLIIALSNALLLIDSNHQLVETLGHIDGVPNNISSLGVDKSHRVTLLANNQLYQLDNDLSLQKVSMDHAINWSTAERMSERETAHIAQRYRSNIISLETLLLDIHSGRFFGSYGTLFFDLIGIVLLFLAFTGVIIWIKQRLK